LCNQVREVVETVIIFSCMTSYMEHPAKTYDVAVIGAGIVGCAAAAFLSVDGRNSVAVIDKENDAACGATGANTGILHAGYDPVPGTLKASMNMEGIRLWPTLIRHLDIPCRQCGSLVVVPGKRAANPEGYAQQGRGPPTGEAELLEELFSRGEGNGVKGLEIIDGETARRLSPALSSAVSAALYAPGARVISPYLAAIRLAEFASLNGTDFYLNKMVKGVASNTGNGLLSINTGDDVPLLRAGAVINAAGIHSGEIAGSIGGSTNDAGREECKATSSCACTSVRPQRGEYFVLDPGADLPLNNIVFPLPTVKGKGVVVCPTAGGGILVGPGAEDVPCPGDTATTARGLERVWDSARSMVPGIRREDIIAQFAGIRAVPENGDFIINESPSCPGLFNAIGIDSPGLTAAPAIALRLVRLAARAGVVDAPFSFHDLPDRVFRDFRERRRVFMTRSAARRLPGTGGMNRMICRCEKITWEKVLEALLSPFPARDLDGIKKRTRAGMGRCQGGFCLPRIVELVGEHGLMAAGEITKRGGKSRLFAGEKPPGRK